MYILRLRLPFDACVLCTSNRARDWFRWEISTDVGVMCAVDRSLLLCVRASKCLCVLLFFHILTCIRSINKSKQFYKWILFFSSFFRRNIFQTYKSIIEVLNWCFCVKNKCIFHIYCSIAVKSDHENRPLIWKQTWKKTVPSGYYKRLKLSVIEFFRWFGTSLREIRIGSKLFFGNYGNFTPKIRQTNFPFWLGLVLCVTDCCFFCFVFW